MITERDRALLYFVNIFGYSFNTVVGSGTLWASPETSKGRLKKLEDWKLIRFKNTGLMTPRRAFFLTERAKNYLRELGIDNINNKKEVSIQSVEHLMLEQKVYFILSKIGEVERTTVYTHHNKLNHVPDMIYNNSYFLEIEITQKNKNQYKEIVSRMGKEKNLKGVVYVTKNLEFAKTLAKSLPTWDRLFFIDFDTLYTNIKEHQKIKPFKQFDLIVN